MSMGQEESASPSILLSDKESIGERPKSPWTPSYSVTVQGPGLTEDQPADGLEHIPDCALINNPQEVSSAPAILLSVPDENPVVASDSDSELPVAGLAPEVSMTTQTASGIVTPKSDGVATWSVECTDPIFVSDGQLAVANSVDLPELSQYDNETTHQATPPAAQSVLAPIEVVAESDEPSADSLNSDRTDLSSLTNADPVNAGHLATSDQTPSMEMTAPLEHLLPEAAMEVEAASSVTEMTPSLVAEDRPTISQPQAFPCNDTQGEEVVSKSVVSTLYFLTLTLFSDSMSRVFHQWMKMVTQTALWVHWMPRHLPLLLGRDWNRQLPPVSSQEGGSRLRPRCSLRKDEPRWTWQPGNLFQFEHRMINHLLTSYPVIDLQLKFRYQLLTFPHRPPQQPNQMRTRRRRDGGVLSCRELLKEFIPHIHRHVSILLYTHTD